MKLSDEIVQKAAQVYSNLANPSAWVRKRMCAALTAVLPDIEKEIREECAAVADTKAAELLASATGHAEGGHAIAVDIAAAIRSLSPSTQTGGEMKK